MKKLKIKDFTILLLSVVLLLVTACGNDKNAVDMNAPETVTDEQPAEAENIASALTFDEVAAQTSTSYVEESEHSSFIAKNYYGEIEINMDFTADSKEQMALKNKTLNDEQRHILFDRTGIRSLLVFIVDDKRSLQVFSERYINADIFTILIGTATWNNGTYTFDVTAVDVQDSKSKIVKIETGMNYLGFVYEEDEGASAIIYNRLLVISKSDAYIFLTTGKLPGFEDDEQLNADLSAILKLKPEFEYLRGDLPNL